MVSASARAAVVDGEAADAGVDDRPCASDNDCANAAGGPCASARCRQGRCELVAEPAGTPLPDVEQLVGDCQISVCDGSGQREARPDDTDAPGGRADPCATRSCRDGELVLSLAPEGTICNDTGACMQGECSVCRPGVDCTAPSDCRVHVTECNGAERSCVATDRAIEGKACGAGAFCHAGQCVPCEVGVACGEPVACRTSRITSCLNGPVCDTEYLSGMACGSDSAGTSMTCRAGECVQACRPGSCAAESDPCMPSHWECPDDDSEPECVRTPALDGLPCGPESSCHAGSCVRAALVNGGFLDGLRGWDLRGDASRFYVADDVSNDSRRSIVTWVGASNELGNRATGSVSQTFVVPDDAVALRFVVSGGHAYVRLREANDNVVEEVTAADSNDSHIPVSWDLTGRRGQSVTLAIEDDIATDAWGFIASTGFDVIREGMSPLRNPDFAADLEGWDQSGDAAFFEVYDDYNYSGGASVTTTGVSAYGRRRSVSSYVRDRDAPRTADLATGTLSQSFSVPADAVALRFNVHGGKVGAVSLLENAAVLRSVHGANDNGNKLPVSWDLSVHRGKTLTIAIVDEAAGGEWGFIGCSGFDVITSSNGP